MILKIIFLLFPCSLGVRLPKWLENPPRLTNIPFLPPTDIGQKCHSSGRVGVCADIRTGCREEGQTSAGFCTIFKSTCCVGKLSLHRIKVFFFILVLTIITSFLQKLQGATPTLDCHLQNLQIPPTHLQRYFEINF